MTGSCLGRVGSQSGFMVRVRVGLGLEFDSGHASESSQHPSWYQLSWSLMWGLIWGQNLDQGLDRTEFGVGQGARYSLEQALQGGS